MQAECNRMIICFAEAPLCLSKTMRTKLQCEGILNRRWELFLEPLPELIDILFEHLATEQHTLFLTNSWSIIW